TVTFTATVAGNGTTIKPTGMVTFSEGSTILGQKAVNSSGVATFLISFATPGGHNITATYASDLRFAASSGNDTQTINNNQTTSTSVTSSPNPSTVNSAV